MLARITTHLQLHYTIKWQGKMYWFVHKKERKKERKEQKKRGQGLGK